MSTQLPPACTSQQRLCLRECLSIVREEQEWPVAQSLLLRLARLGVNDPEECIGTIPGEYLRVERPLVGGSKARLTVAGFALIEPHAPELHRFIGAVRGCVTAYSNYAPESSSQVQPLVVNATDLLWPQLAPVLVDLRIVGLLLDAEALGAVRFDSAHEWGIELNARIWRFRVVGDVDGYLLLQYGWGLDR